jgi:hypothetical protein
VNRSRSIARLCSIAGLTGGCFVAASFAQPLVLTPSTNQPALTVPQPLLPAPRLPQPATVTPASVVPAPAAAASSQPAGAPQIVLPVQPPTPAQVLENSLQSAPTLQRMARPPAPPPSSTASSSVAETNAATLQPAASLSLSNAVPGSWERDFLLRGLKYHWRNTTAEPNP